MRPCPKWITCWAIARSSKPKAMPISSRQRRTGARQRHHGVRETAAQLVDSFEGRARAFLQVQNGCDHRCTFCIIPYGRGNSRSVPMGAVVEEARRLAENGFPEIVLTGVDLTSYGADLPGAPTLGAAGAQDAEAGAGTEAAAAFLHRFHRGRRRADARHRGRRAADAAFPSFGAVGRRHDPQAHEAPPFPRRHDRVSAKTVRAPAARSRLRRRSDRGLSHRNRGDVREHACAWWTMPGFRILHVFPFSPRKGTPAARMPQLPQATGEGTRRAAARQRRGGAGGAAWERWSAASRCCWWKSRHRPHALFRACAISTAMRNPARSCGRAFQERNATSLMAELLQ